jgi:hypothetical protein
LQNIDDFAKIIIMAVIPLVFCRLPYALRLEPYAFDIFPPERNALTLPRLLNAPQFAGDIRTGVKGHSNLFSGTRAVSP